MNGFMKGRGIREKHSEGNNQRRYRKKKKNNEKKINSLTPRSNLYFSLPSTIQFS